MRLQQCRAFHHQKDQKSALFPPQLSSSLIQRGGRVGQLNGPHLPFTRPCQRDKAQVDFWVLIVLSEVTKRNLSVSNLRVVLTSLCLPPSLYPSIVHGDSDNRGPCPWTRSKALLLTDIRSCSFPCSFLPIPVIPCFCCTSGPQGADEDFWAVATQAMCILKEQNVTAA